MLFCRMYGKIQIEFLSFFYTGKGENVLNGKHTILIADDSEMNRAILADMLGEEYEIVEVENGAQAVVYMEQHSVELSLLLLDIVMPEMDGFGVLKVMKEHRWIEDIPVIMISAENSPSYIERAFELGASDFIIRPFNELIVRRRAINTITLYAKQKKLVGMVADQIFEKEQSSSMMIDILSHIVEFRNGESGLHVQHVHVLTDLLLHRLVQKTDRYELSQNDISLITTASALHDIGKIAIDEKILNKPGRLTDEEFAIMKTHSGIGAEMLDNMPFYREEPLLKRAYEICRWHHERYDGRGYPDGLKGDDIPISAQIVALADVYDALTSERVYKKAFSHEKAVEMILAGQCGAFNPLVLECLTDVADRLDRELKQSVPKRSENQTMQNVVLEMRQHDELAASERTLQLLEREREKYSFFAAMSQEIQFEYNVSPAILTLTPWGAEKLGTEEVLMDPRKDDSVQKILGMDVWNKISAALRSTSRENPLVRYDCKINYQGDERWSRIIARAMWSPEEPHVYRGAIGKVTDIHDTRLRLDVLERLATHDRMTGLLNHASAKEQIIERLERCPDAKYALVIFDLDHFKTANDTYGHSFGDEVLIYMAHKLEQCIRKEDIACRAGGDEFLLFLEYQHELEPIVERIFQSLTGKYKDFTISVSMGVVRTEKIGTGYEELFHAADQALYAVKRSGRGHYRFYDDSMNKMLSVISSIDNGEEKPETSVNSGEEEH